MGLWISLCGIYGRTVNEVFALVEKYTIVNNVGIEQTNREATDIHVLKITSQNNTVGIYFPRSLFDETEISILLSKELSTSVILCKICDGDLWLYSLYDNGELISQFNSNPSYWEDSDAEFDKWKGSPELVVKSFGNIDPNTIKDYLVFKHSISDLDAKAYHDDTYPYRDAESRQLFDFIRKLDIPYPTNPQNSVTYFSWDNSTGKYDFTCDEEEEANETSKKPWWKFW